ncbi:hypothetical protein [Mycobacterium intermedium]|uniref:hypothetical protein n=1 Tax=Mycobacterium intermedium TaxID=28445 RepID=UPI0009A18948|nr:hypothetical protein [Mycobacterium intermedium]
MTASQHWLLDAIRNFAYDVASCLPPVFEAYARIFHPAYGADAPEPQRPITWRAVAQANGRIVHPAMEWGSLVGSWEAQSQPGLWARRPDTGRLPVPTTAALAGVLQRCSKVDRVMYALWTGYGDLHIADADLIELPNRPMYLVAGSIDDATEPFAIPGRTANLWWAGDRQWCVATDVDLMSTYVGASRPCIRAILEDDGLEALPVPPRSADHMGRGHPEPPSGASALIARAPAHFAVGQGRPPIQPSSL